MIINSDFRDYYDVYADNGATNLELERYMNSGPTRIQAFDLLSTAGYRTPWYTVLKRLDVEEIKRYNGNYDILVYLSDEHAGEGKIIMPVLDAIEKYPDNLCAYYHQRRRDTQATHVRLLWIGTECYQFEYTNHDTNEWRSNVGDAVTIRNITNSPYYTSEFGVAPFTLMDKYPLGAIDFIRDQYNEEWLAVDLNVSPGLRAVQEYLPSGQGVHDMIEQRLSEILVTHAMREGAHKWRNQTRDGSELG